MLKHQSSDAPAGIEPTPLFATDAEIECAQRLRQQLEERYLGHASALEELLTPLGEGH